jgi:N-acetyl-anhydromuramyl-L-alanine amidase AmpD
VVGPDGIWQCVREKDRAWAAGATANARGIHLELVGRAGHTDWTTGPGLAVLEQAAPLVADICKRRGIVRQGLDVHRLMRGDSGIVTHATITEAWRESTHLDPGMAGDVRWPWELWLELVEAAAHG